MAMHRDKFDALNDMAKTLGTTAEFHPSMTVDQFYSQMAEILLAIPAYIDKEVKRAVKPQDQE